MHEIYYELDNDELAAAEKLEGTEKYSNIFSKNVLEKVKDIINSSEKELVYGQEIFGDIDSIEAMDIGGGTSNIAQKDISKVGLNVLIPYLKEFKEGITQMSSSIAIKGIPKTKNGQASSDYNVWVGNFVPKDCEENIGKWKGGYKRADFNTSIYSSDKTVYYPVEVLLGEYIKKIYTYMVGDNIKDEELVVEDKDNHNSNNKVLVVGIPSTKEWKKRKRGYKELIKKYTGVENVILVEEAHASVMYLYQKYGETFRKADNRKKAILVIDIGATTVDVCILSPGKNFTDSQAAFIGGQNVDDCIKRQVLHDLNIDEEEINDRYGFLINIRILKEEFNKKASKEDEDSKGTYQKYMEGLGSGWNTLRVNDESIEFDYEFMQRAMNLSFTGMDKKEGNFYYHLANFFYNDVYKIINDAGADNIGTVLFTGGCSCLTEMEAFAKYVFKGKLDYNEKDVLSAAAVNSAFKAREELDKNLNPIFNDNVDIKIFSDIEDSERCVACGAIILVENAAKLERRICELTNKLEDELKTIISGISEKLAKEVTDLEIRKIHEQVDAWLSDDEDKTVNDLSSAVRKAVERYDISEDLQARIKDMNENKHDFSDEKKKINDLMNNLFKQWTKCMQDFPTPNFEIDINKDNVSFGTFGKTISEKLKDKINYKDVYKIHERISNFFSGIISIFGGETDDIKDKSIYLNKKLEKSKRSELGVKFKTDSSKLGNELKGNYKDIIENSLLESRTLADDILLNSISSMIDAIKQLTFTRVKEVEKTSV